MVGSLVKCPSCARHVRFGESACPFCAAAVPAGLQPRAYVPRRQVIGKGATALALALAAVGCGETGSEVFEPVDAAADTALDAGADTLVDGGIDGGIDSGMDAGRDTMSDSDVGDEGGSFPIYK